MMIDEESASPLYIPASICLRVWHWLLACLLATTFTLLDRTSLVPALDISLRHLPPPYLITSIIVILLHGAAPPGAEELRRLFISPWD